MAKNISVPEKYLDLYLKALNEKKKQLEIKIDEFENEIENINNHIKSLTSMSIFNEYPLHSPVKWETKGYIKEWPWTQKVSYFADKKGLLFTTNEIVELILNKEQEQERDKVRSSISAVLSNRVKTGEYKKFQHPATQITYYGPAEWFEGEKPKDKFLPSEIRQLIK
ncbi:MAG: hypothetical protein ACNS60_17140 [Candidatus Cyclobacteriaceae bacterium M2_1C_046]